MASQRIVPVKGMDYDSSPRVMQPDQARLIKNGTIISTNNPNEAGSITNIEGNEISFIVPELNSAYNYTDPFNLGYTGNGSLYIVGSGKLRDEIILATTAPDGDPPTNTGIDQIWRLSYNSEDQVNYVHDTTQLASVVCWWTSADGVLPVDATFHSGERVIIKETFGAYTIGEIYQRAAGSWVLYASSGTDKQYIALIDDFDFPKVLLTEVVNFWDASTALPSEVLNDSYICSVSGNGWTKDLVYTWNGAFWDEYIPPVGNIVSAYVTELSKRYYCETLDWYEFPANYKQKWTYIGDSNVDYNAYVSGWHLSYDNTLIPGVHLVYQNDLDFSIDNKVKIIGNVEDSKIGKIYFADGVNVLRHLNVYDEDAYLLEVNELDIVNNVIFSPLKSRISIGGVYKAGVVQHSYQLYKKNGPETAFSSPFHLIPLAEASDTRGNDLLFKGDQYDEPESVFNTGKSVKITIEDLDEDYEYIRIVAIYYDRLYAVPRIRLIYDGTISSGRNVNVVDDGSLNLRTYTIEEFNTIGGMYIRPLELETKDNRLIIGNYTEEIFDVIYDARAYSFKAGFDTISIENTIGDAPVTYTYGVDLDDVPETSDAYHSTGFGGYMALSDPNNYGIVSGAVLGGSGPNISYEFRTKDIEIDSYKTTTGTNVFRYNADKKLFALGALGDQFSSGFCYNSYAGDLVKSQAVGYQRGEKYRFGIVLYDGKGRASYVKWIADIQFPESNTDTASYENNALTCLPFERLNTAPSDLYAQQANIMYIKFFISNLPEEVKSYQIVRLERNEEDESIIAAGYAFPTSTRWIGTTFQTSCDFYPVGHLYQYDEDLEREDGTHYLPSTQGWTSWGNGKCDIDGTLNRFDGSGDSLNHQYAFEVASPEATFSQKNIPTDSYFQAKHVGQGYKSLVKEDAEDPLIYNKAQRDTITKSYGLIIKDSVNINITDSIVSTPVNVHDTKNNYLKVGGYNYTPYTVKFQGSAKTDFDAQFEDLQGIQSKKGTCYICTTDYDLYDLPTDMGGGDYQFTYGYIRRDIETSQYGGESFNSRTGNEYITASPVISSDETSVNVFGGDTYISIFEYNRIIADLTLQWLVDFDDDWGKDCGYSELFIAPIESRICIDYRSDATRTQESNLESPSYLMQEELGSWGAGNGGRDTPIYEQETDLYLYNEVYSMQNKTRKFFTPFIFDIDEPTTKSYDARLAISELKINNQLSDSWLKFLPSNIYDLEYNYGPISSIKSLGNGIIVFQKEAVAYMPINERALVQNQDSPAIMVLGSGDILGKYSYISTTNGTINRDAVVKASSGIYFYDEQNNEIYVVGQNLTPLTTLKGIKTYLTENVPATVADESKVITGYGVCSAYDQSKGRIYISFGRHAGDFTVLYNENAGMIESILDFSSYGFIHDRNRIISCGKPTGLDPDEESNPIYTRRFWLHDSNSVYASFYGTNFNFTVDFIFNPEYDNMKVFDSAEMLFRCEDYPTEYFDTLTLTCKYGTATLNLGTYAKYRFGTWRHLIPRISSSRIVDNYIKLRYTGAINTHKVTLDGVSVQYRTHNLLSQLT